MTDEMNKDHDDDDDDDSKAWAHVEYHIMLRVWHAEDLPWESNDRYA